MCVVLPALKRVWSIQFVCDYSNVDSINGFSFSDNVDCKFDIYIFSESTNSDEHPKRRRKWTRQYTCTSKVGSSRRRKKIVCLVGSDPKQPPRDGMENKVHLVTCIFKQN